MLELETMVKRQTDGVTDLYSVDRSTKKLLQEKLNATTPTLKLICTLPIMPYTTSRHYSESTAASNQSRTTDAVFTKLQRPLAKDRKNILANSRPIWRTLA